MKNIFFLLFGVLIGTWISWPGIFLPENWECFNDIIEKSRNEKISIKAFLRLNPKFLFTGIPKNKLSKFRVLSDNCIR